MVAITLSVNTWPNFYKEGLKEKGVIIINSILTLLVLVSLIHSYWTKSLHQTKIQMILMHILSLLSFLNPPGEEMGPNHRARAKAKLIIAVMYYFMQTFLMTELFEKHFHKILLIWFNGLILWLVFCFQLPSASVSCPMMV